MLNLQSESKKEKKMKNRKYNQDGFEVVTYKGKEFNPLNWDEYMELCGPDKIILDEEHASAVGHANLIRIEHKLVLQAFKKQ